MLPPGTRFAHKLSTIYCKDGSEKWEVYHVVSSTPKSMTMFKTITDKTFTGTWIKILGARAGKTKLLNHGCGARRYMLKEDDAGEYFVSTAREHVRLNEKHHNVVTYLARGKCTWKKSKKAKKPAKKRERLCAVARAVIQNGVLLLQPDAIATDYAVPISWLPEHQTNVGLLRNGRVEQGSLSIENGIVSFRFRFADDVLTNDPSGDQHFYWAKRSNAVPVIKRNGSATEVDLRGFEENGQLVLADARSGESVIYLGD